MLRPLLAPILAACLAVAPTAGPVRADTDDVAKVLAGIAALYLAGRYMEQRRGQPFEIDIPGLAGNARAPAPTYGGHRRIAEKTLPDICRMEIERGGLYNRAYDAQCLERRLASPDLLPRSCQRPVPGARRDREIYDARCLQREGWREARAH